MGDKIVKSKNLCCQPVVFPSPSLLIKSQNIKKMHSRLNQTPEGQGGQDFGKSVKSMTIRFSEFHHLYSIEMDETLDFDYFHSKTQCDQLLVNSKKSLTHH